MHPPSFPRQDRPPLPGSTDATDPEPVGQALLVVGTLADSNTAYVGSQRMAVQLPNTRLLTETGGGHTALLNRSDCVDRYTSEYLIGGTLPGPGTVCNQNHNPF